MGAVNGGLIKNCQRMSAKGLLNHLRGDEIPCRERMALTRRRRSLSLTVPKDAWREHRSLEDPGSVDAYYLPDSGLMVVDLNE